MTTAGAQNWDGVHAFVHEPLSNEEILGYGKLIEEAELQGSDLYMNGTCLLMQDELARCGESTISTERTAEIELILSPYWARPGVPQNARLYDQADFARWQAETPRQRTLAARELFNELVRIRQIQLPVSV